MITDKERMDWLEANCKEEYLYKAPAEYEDTRMKWVLPTLISNTCVNSRIGFREAIDNAIEQKRRVDDSKN